MYTSIFMTREVASQTLHDALTGSSSIIIPSEDKQAISNPFSYLGVIQSAAASQGYLGTLKPQSTKARHIPRQGLNDTRRHQAKDAESSRSVLSKANLAANISSATRRFGVMHVCSQSATSQTTVQRLTTNPYRSCFAASLAARQYRGLVVSRMTQRCGSRGYFFWSRITGPREHPLRHRGWHKTERKKN
jgi:hypothetical protein